MGEGRGLLPSNTKCGPPPGAPELLNRGCCRRSAPPLPLSLAHSQRGDPHSAWEPETKWVFPRSQQRQGQASGGEGACLPPGCAWSPRITAPCHPGRGRRHLHLSYLPPPMPGRGWQDGVLAISAPGVSSGALLRPLPLEADQIPKSLPGHLHPSARHPTSAQLLFLHLEETWCQEPGSIRTANQWAWATPRLLGRAVSMRGRRGTETASLSLKASLLDPSPPSSQSESPNTCVGSLPGVGVSSVPWGDFCCLAGLRAGGAGSPTFDVRRVALVAKGWLSEGVGAGQQGEERQVLPSWAPSPPLLGHI